MFINQVFKYKYDFWRYIIGVAVVVAGIIIGQIPLLIALVIEKGAEVMTMTESQMMTALESNYFLFLMLLTYAVALVFLLFIVKKLHEQPITALTTSRAKIDWSRFWFAFGLVTIFVIITTIGDYLTNPTDYVFNFQPVPFLILCVIAVIFVPLQTSFE